MPYSNKAQSLAKVFQTENYKRGQFHKVCLGCKGKPKVITEFSTRRAHGRLYLKSKCRQCDSRYVRSFRLAPVESGPEGAHYDTPPVTTYPNLEMLGRGCVSGGVGEWPVLKLEARAALKELEELRVLVGKG